MCLILTLKLEFLYILTWIIQEEQPELKFKQDRHQSLGPEMTGTGTNHRDQKGPGRGQRLVPVLELVPFPRRSLVTTDYKRLLVVNTSYYRLLVVTKSYYRLISGYYRLKQVTIG